MACSSVLGIFCIHSCMHACSSAVLGMQVGRRRPSARPASTRAASSLAGMGMADAAARAEPLAFAGIARTAPLEAFPAVAPNAPGRGGAGVTC